MTDRYDDWPASNEGAPPTPIAEQHRLRRSLRDSLYVAPAWAGRGGYALAWDQAEWQARVTEQRLNFHSSMRHTFEGMTFISPPVSELECLAEQPNWAQRERAGLAEQLYRERMGRCEYLGDVAPFATEDEYRRARFMIPAPDTGRALRG